MRENWARFVRNLLRWLFVLMLTVGGVYVALRLPLFTALPGGLSLVLSVEFVGLLIVFVLEILIRRIGLGQMADELIWRLLVSRPEAAPGASPVTGD